MNSLNYEIRKRPFEELGDGACRNERIYFDFKVSDSYLSEKLRTKNYDMIGAICKSNNKKYELSKISEFLLEKESELESGRIIIYGCAECLDIYCGAITAQIESKDDTIVWHSFGYENGFEEIEFEKYKEIGPFKFDKKQYKKKFEEMKNAI